ncbi:LytTR family DNA-binding domain-containing protein [Tenacibaculum sp. FZY0031]|uniref:LytR/AlgR family response regulator transcription factor n=1 Tax=unclassified Tenacibaculum TaxID=2635139 RepID=UPI002EC32712|nr:LytTR family DNA-binding domain-containing protein [Tenacibaculum sp. FZY0031]
MKCIIIEDELPAQTILKKYVGKIPDAEIVHTFQTAMQANEFLKNNTADVVFLDINLPDIPGLDFIKTVKKPPKIVITTAYPDYAVSSFELDTIVDYLVKPFSFDRFLKAVSKVENQLNNLNTSDSNIIYLNIDKVIHKVNLEDIFYIESDRNYLHFIASDKKLTIIDSLKNWKETLNSHQFIQVHKSYIVNFTKIEKFTGTSLHFENRKVPIGRTYKSNLSMLLKTKRR